MNVEKDGHDGSISSIHIDHSKMSLNNDTLKELYSQWHEGGEDDVGIVEKTELDVYLDASYERSDGTFDILKWWKRHIDTYKVLAQMARDILAVPISTMSIESAFSTLGRVLDPFRSSLGPKTVETLICTQDWLRASTIRIDVEQLMDDMEKYEASNYIYSLHLLLHFVA
uniref:HAT C-terminal dimerisation domain-containing protein n=1 Tax=Opuntia streptacantha TaxID=393608 RepID=A0A7C8ZQ40_OPUST